MDAAPQAPLFEFVCKSAGAAERSILFGLPTRSQPGEYDVFQCGVCGGGCILDVYVCACNMTDNLLSDLSPAVDCLPTSLTSLKLADNRLLFCYNQEGRHYVFLLVVVLMLGLLALET